MWLWLLAVFGDTPTGNQYDPPSTSFSRAERLAPSGGRLRSARSAAPRRGQGGGKKDKLQKQIYTNKNTELFSLLAIQDLEKHASLKMKYSHIANQAVVLMQIQTKLRLTGIRTISPSCCSYQKLLLKKIWRRRVYSILQPDYCRGVASIFPYPKLKII
jgi:hypothetical protein